MHGATGERVIKGSAGQNFTKFHKISEMVEGKDVDLIETNKFGIRLFLRRPHRFQVIRDQR